METMQRFDFEQHFNQFGHTTDIAEIALLKKGLDDYVAALDPAEHEQFKVDFNVHLKRVNDRTEIEIAFLKEMLTIAQPA